MPFQISSQPFGQLPTDRVPLTEYLLEHTETGEFVTVIPAFGAVLRRLVLRKGNHLYALLQSPDSPQALLADESYANALLYPFPSRIRHGIYTFQEEAYALTMNEVRHDNALHGFVHGKPFSVVSQEATATEAQLVLRYDHAGDTPGYPFPFALTIAYQLVLADHLTEGSPRNNDRRCALKISFTAHNTGLVPAPAAFGWHPYFTFKQDTADTEESVDDMTLAMPARNAIELDETMIPTGKYVFRQAETVPLRGQELDSIFRITSSDAQSYAETILTSGTTGARLIVGQQTGTGKLNYLVCYTPARRDSLAIEPLTANVNAFNNGDGLAVLNPNETLSGAMWVRLD